MKTPTAIGPYPVLRVIAQGGMSVVYEVADPATGATYAAKVLDARLMDDPRFEQEYVALSRVDHPNIVRGLRYGRTEEGAPYLVLELIFGDTAQARAKAVGRPGDPARTLEAVRIAHDVASAIAHMHAHGLVHRDLKSNNVIVSGDGHVKLLDFGTVRLMKGGVAFTRRGDFVGTFAYASPEQLTGNPVGPPSDLYSLGVLLYRMLTGKKPFDGENPEAVARAHLEYLPPPPHEVTQGIPEDLSIGVMQLLQKAARDRPSSATAVEAWLAPMLPDHRGRDAAPARIGRGDQLARVDAALTDAFPGQVVLFAGVPDADPAHHLRRATDEAGRRGMRIVRVDANADAKDPRDALRMSLSEQLPVAQVIIEVDGDPSMTQLADALGAQAVADKHPIVVAVSGTEMAPRTTIARLFEIADRARSAGHRVLFLMTWGPNPPARPGLSMVRVAPLTASEVVEIARRRLGVAGIPPARVRRLLDLCGSRPSVLEEVLLVGSVSEDRVPERLVQVILADLGRLTRAERRVMEVIARAEMAMEPELVGFIAEMPVDVTTATMNALVIRGWLKMEEGRARPIHGVLAEVIRGSTRRLRSNLYASKMAERNSELPEGRVRVQALLDADHRADALSSAIEHAGLPGVRAQLQALLQTPPPADRAVRAWVRLGEAMNREDVPLAEVDRVYQKAGEAVRGMVERGEVAMLGAGIARRRGQVDTEIRHYNDAIRGFESGGEPMRVAAARAGLAETMRRLGELERAEMLARQAVSGGVDATALAHVLLDRGQLRDAEALFAEAMKRETEDGSGPWRSAAGYVRACRHQGKWSAAATTLREVMPRARAEASPRRLSRLLLAAAEIDIDLYRIGQARDALDEIRAIHGGVVPEHLVPAVGRVSARIHHIVGEVDAALVILDGALEHAARNNFGRATAELKAQRAAVAASRDGPDPWRRDFAAARDTLLIFGAFPALAKVCGLWAEASGGVDTPEWIFRHASGWMDREPAIPARLERALAAMRTGKRRNEMIENRRLDAFLILDTLREGLSREDAGALDVHPYAAEVRRT